MAFAGLVTSSVVRIAELPSSIQLLAQARRPKRQEPHEQEIRLIEAESSYRWIFIGVAGLIVALLIFEPLRRRYKKWKRRRARKRRDEDKK
jgi:hypothetical protein